MLLATDLDGTLFKPKKPLGVVERHNRCFLSDLSRRGWTIAAISGRNSNCRRPLVDALGFDIVFIGANGGFTLDESGKLINKVPLSRELLLEIYATMVDRYGIGAWLALDETDMDYFDTHGLSGAITALVRVANFLSFYYRERYTMDRERFLHRLAEGGVCKLQAITGIGRSKTNQAKEAYVAIRDLIGDRCSVANSGFAIELTAIEASKGRALERLCAERGIQRDDVYVVGDSGNDVSMFDAFPHSFCMEKADPWVRAHAAHIVRRVSDIGEFLNDSDSLKKDLETFETRRKMPLGPSGQ